MITSLVLKVRQQCCKESLTRNEGKNVDCCTTNLYEMKSQRAVAQMKRGDFNTYRANFRFFSELPTHVSGFIPTKRPKSFSLNHLFCPPPPPFNPWINILFNVWLRSKCAVKRKYYYFAVNDIYITHYLASIFSHVQKHFKASTENVFVSFEIMNATHLCLFTWGLNKIYLCRRRDQGPVTLIGLELLQNIIQEDTLNG